MKKIIFTLIALAGVSVAVQAQSATPAKKSEAEIKAVDVKISTPKTIERNEAAPPAEANPVPSKVERSADNTAAPAQTGTKQAVKREDVIAPSNKVEVERTSVKQQPTATPSGKTATKPKQ